jgi:hypothetical protein
MKMIIKYKKIILKKQCLKCNFKTVASCINFLKLFLAVVFKVSYYFIVSIYLFMR